jgi:hypothetical protein
MFLTKLGTVDDVDAKLADKFNVVKNRQLSIPIQ